MSEGKISVDTRKKVFEKWDGKCAFCGIGLTVEEHHIVAISDNPALSDDPENLILLCNNHHALTRKRIEGEGERFALSISDINDLKNTEFCHLEKRGFYFEIPQKFAVNLGSCLAYACPIVLQIRGKPLIEIRPQTSTWFDKRQNYYLYTRFFDEKNNFIGGMFANHWASIANEEWQISATNDEISVKNRNKPLYIRFVKTPDAVNITGLLQYNGAVIRITPQALVIGGITFRGTSASHTKVAYRIG